jgi:hypothetical protein
MSYSNKHTADQCDKCLEEVGKANLHKLPFIYLDMNDTEHEDVSEQYGYPKGFGYRQYSVCKSCHKKEGLK